MSVKRTPKLGRIAGVVLVAGVCALPATAGAVKPDEKVMNARLEQHKKFEAQRAEAAKTRKHLPPLPAATPMQNIDVQGLLERVVDGMVVVSAPYDPEIEHLLLQTHRRAKSREEAMHAALFDGRVFTAYRIEGLDWTSFEKNVGKEVRIGLKANNLGHVAATVRPVR